MRVLKHVSIWIALHLMILSTIYLILPANAVSNNKPKYSTIENLQNEKDFKKLLRTKNNVLVLFIAGFKDNQGVLKVFRDTSEAVKGLGTHVVIDCTTNDLRKLCKKLKIIPEPYAIKHYKDGEFHKDYDRQITVTSMSNFMRDPQGDLPWEEDASGSDVLHVPDTNVSSNRLICQ